MRKFNFYCFTDILNENIIKNIKKFNNISIIYKPNDFNLFNKKNIKELIKFCKKQNIKFYLYNNYKLAFKYKADGICLASNQKKIETFMKRKNFKIIGHAHNQFEYYIKTLQHCETTMLSPLFYNKKYSKNKILNIPKFNLIAKNWKTNICALGGINNSNLKKLKMINGNGAAFVSLVYDCNLKKKPLYI